MNSGRMGDTLPARLSPNGGASCFFRYTLFIHSRSPVRRSYSSFVGLSTRRRNQVPYSWGAHAAWQAAHSSFSIWAVIECSITFGSGRWHSRQDFDAFCPFSFLISSPMVNEVALIMLWGLFGWKIALIYIGTGLLVAIVAGIVIGKLKMERYVQDYVWEMQVGNGEIKVLNFQEKIDYAREYTLGLLKKIWPYVVVGVGLGAFIHGYVPTDFLARWAGRDNPFAVPVAVALGVPLYSNAAGVIPIVHALMEKGMAIGTVLAFMMAVTALSLPEAIILKNVLKTRLLVVFFGTVAVAIVIVGYLFNAML